MPRDSVVLLSGVTATGAGSAANVEIFDKLTLYVTASAVTTGGTVTLQAQDPLGNWGTLASVAVSANGTTITRLADLAVKSIRANLTSRTDGTFTVSMDLSGPR